MKIYIAGPMRGYPRFNFDAFEAAARRWRAIGHEPYSPAAIDIALGLDPESPNVSEAFCRRAMQIDFALLYSADAIALLPGWEASAGATLELALAQFLKLGVYDAETCLPIEPARCPWKPKETSHAPRPYWVKAPTI